MPKKKGYKKKGISDKIYWRDIPASAKIGSVKLKGSNFYYKGKLVYWTGQEAYTAQQFLNQKAKVPFAKQYRGY